VTVLFADVSGFTAMSEKLDPEEVTVIMNRCFAALGGPIDRHGGTIDKFIGDCVMALFGAPVAHEDDPDRACRAALEMREALLDLNRDLPVPLAVNIGINSGIVVAGEIGTEGRRDYTVMGDAVNTAQRIQSAAKGGQIYVSKSVHRATAAGFDFEELPPISAKGKQEPVPVFRLKGRLSEERPGTRPGPRIPLVGRERELATVRKRLGEAGRGVGGAIFLTGEAGIGKTRLRSEIVREASAAGFAIAVGRGFDHRRELPFGPLLDLARRLFGVSEGDDREQTSRKIEEGHPDLPLSRTDRLVIARDLGAADDPSRELFDRNPHFASWLELLRALSSGASALVVLEDLHWADPLTLDLVSLALDETGSRPLLLLLTSRPGLASPRGLAVTPDPIELRELELDDAYQLLALLTAGHPLPAEIAEAVLRRSGGNPFFLEELVMSLGSGSGVGSADSLPETVQAVVAARIDRLGDETKRVLQAASVVGRSFSQPVLEEILGEPGPIEPILARLESEALVYGRPGEKPPAWSFRQAITQEVAYASLLRQVARPMHLRAARALEKIHRERLEERYSELARHFDLGGDPVSAVDYQIRAADADRRAFALGRSEELFLAALASLARLAEGGPSTPVEPSAAPLRRITSPLAVPAVSPLSADRIGRFSLRARNGLGELRRILGRWSEAEEDFRFALREAERLGEPSAPFELALGRIAFARGDFEEARRRADAGRRGSPGAALHLLGIVADRQGDLPRAEALLREAAGTLGRGGDPHGEAWALADLGETLLHAGRLEEALAEQERSLSIKRSIDDRQGVAASLVNLGNVLQGQAGRETEGANRYEEALELFRLVGDRRGVASTLTNLSVLDVRLGRLERAEERLRSAIAIQAGLGDEPGRGAALLTRGIVARERNRPDEALLHLDAATAIFETMAWKAGIDIATANRGGALVEAGRAAEAFAPLEAARQAFEALGDERTLRELELFLGAAESATGRGRDRFEKAAAAILAEGEAERAELVARVRKRIDRLC
jgi:class 3 adenylate cyclase/tetratricopeptide (TPR) repeat protein